MNRLFMLALAVSLALAAYGTLRSVPPAPEHALDKPDLPRGVEF